MIMCGLSRELTPVLTATIIESTNQHARLHTRLNSCNERSSQGRRYEDNQIRGFVQYPDHLLDDVGNTSSLDPKFSSDLTVEKFESVDHQTPDSQTASTDFVPKSECDFSARACEEIAVTPPAATVETEGHKINTSIDVSAIEYEVQQGDDVSIDQFPKVHFNFSAAPVNQNQECMIKNKEAGRPHTFYQPYDFPPGYMQFDKENENSLEAAGALWTGPKELANDPEAFQKPGLPRRSLLFEDSTQSNHPVKRPSDSGAKNSLPLEAPLTPIGSELQENFQAIYPSSLKPTITTAKPSGIGLHLNSIVHDVKARAGAVVNVVKSAPRANNISIQEQEPIPLAHSHLFHSTNSSSLFSPTESVYALGYSNMHQYASSSSSRFMLRPLNNLDMVSTVEDQLPSSVKRKYICETDSGSEDVKSISKERKISSDTNDGNSCQRCNCKKSQCLKLYCDCFAAGIYCAEPCTCQGCYNRPEYDDTVNETKLQIQSRNPLAFASKIDEGAQFTPFSARHKRGCNCKRSMCAKKYCECYQAKVGCSDGCRCEGCRNTYGQKGEYAKDKDFVTEKLITERTEGTFFETMAESGKELYRPELVNPHHLSPVTPEVQFWKTDSSKGWLQSAECLHPLSYVASPYVMNTGSPKNLENGGTISRTPYEVQNLLISDKKSYSDFAGDISTISPQLRNLGNLVDKFSSRVEDETPDILKHSLIIPPDAVKVSSPNKKRVSSPQVLQDKHGSISIGGVIGRKFTLKSVPSFPPLSRHLDFRNTSPEKGKDPQCNKDKL